jgi:hypothetical protein
MESLAEVVSGSTDSISAANTDTLQPFTAPPTNDLFIDTGYTKLFARDLISNSSGTYFFHMEAEKLPKLIDLSKLLCEVTFSVVKVVDGREVGCKPGDGVSISNYFVDSLFSKIEIIVNQAPVYTSPSNRYQYTQMQHIVSEERGNEGKGMGHLSFAYPEEFPEETLINRNPFFKARSDRVCIPPPPRPKNGLKRNRDGANPNVPQAGAGSKRKRVIAGSTGDTGGTGDGQGGTGSQPQTDGGDNDDGDNGTGTDTGTSQEGVQQADAAPDVYGVGILTTGFSNSRQFLPWNSDIIVNLTKEKDCHLITLGPMDTTDQIRKPREGQYKVKIKNLSLFYKHYILKDEAYAAQAKMYREGHRSKLYFLKPYANAHCMQMGQQQYTQDLGFPGRRLAKLFVVFMSSDRYIGSMVKASNVYEQPPNMRSVELLFNGRDPLQLDASSLRSVDNSLLPKLYFDYLHNTQIIGMETANNTLSFGQFTRSAFVLSLNLVANGLLESDRLPLLKSGSITLRLNLTVPLREAWYVYYLGYGVEQMACAPGEPPQLSENLEVEK